MKVTAVHPVAEAHAHSSFPCTLHKHLVALGFFSLALIHPDVKTFCGIELCPVSTDQKRVCIIADIHNAVGRLEGFISLPEMCHVIAKTGIEDKTIQRIAIYLVPFRRNGDLLVIGRLVVFARAGTGGILFTGDRQCNASK